MYVGEPGSSGSPTVERTCIFLPPHLSPFGSGTSMKSVGDGSPWLNQSWFSNWIQAAARPLSVVAEGPQVQQRERPRKLVPRHDLVDLLEHHRVRLHQRVTHVAPPRSSPPPLPALGGRGGTQATLFRRAAAFKRRGRPVSPRGCA